MSGIILPDDEEAKKKVSEKSDEVEKARERIFGPSNDEGLAACEIIGRCSSCGIVGHIDYPQNFIPPSDTDKLLSYRPVSCFCPTCKKNTEFVPVEVKQYSDLPFLKSLQDGFKKGKVR